MSSIKSIKDFSVAGERILVRCDFNVPIDAEGNILDDFRIKKSLPTIKYLIDNKAKVILMSHLDPESTGVVDKKYTLDNVASKLSDHLNISIAKESNCVGPEVEAIANKLEQGNVLLLENLRFYKEETDNNEEFAKKLSYLGNIYVNDAFGADHRAHASIVGVPKFLPSCMGFLLEKEITVLNEIMGKSPSTNSGQAEKPMVAVIGGTKVKTKTKFIDKISEVADWVIVSGLIKKEAEEQGIQFKYPEKIIGPTGKLDDLDINKESIEIFKEKILSAKTILWNGPFGKFEEKEYSKGTRDIADAIIESKAFSVVGGGETIEFLQNQGIIDKFNHVSTGGGAMMAYLAGEELPGLEALKR
jgi:phosphoglycerate kinase